MDESLFETGDVFQNGEVLSEEYTPEELPEREQEVEEIVKGLRRVFRGESPKNMFLQGKTGQGKTVTVRRVLEVFERSAEKQDVSVEALFVPCRNLSSSYHVACRIVEEYTGEDPNGHAQQKVFDKMYDVFDNLADNVVLVLDEVDAIGNSDDILYDIPRARDQGFVENVRVGIVGITNDAAFLRNIDRQAGSSLYEKEIRFDAYNATDLRSILERRVEKAFREDTVTNDAIHLCAAYAAQDEGSARQAIEYMYEAGEVADHERASQVTEEHIERAKEKVRHQEVTQGITGLTLQDQIALISVVALESAGETPARTRQIYTEYSTYTTEFADVNTLSFDRTREHLKELDLIGILRREVRSGDERGGKKYFWELDVDLGATIEVLESIDDHRVAEFMEFVGTTDDHASLGDF